MEKVTITINFGNEAMKNMGDLARALRSLAERIEDGRQPTKVMDLNGNAVGKIEFE